MKKYEIYRAERKKGMKYREIAEKHGCSYQNVAQACSVMDENHFRLLSEDDVVYPNLRRWMNENKVNRTEFSRRLGRGYPSNNHGAVSTWLSGKCFPQKRTIDKIIEMTGLTYEELWER
jgi:hypothetical protein